MSDQPKLGELVEGDAERDAIHIAVLPCIADERLKPGQPVNFTDPYENRVGKVKCQDSVGVVDPFLSAPVNTGERCWIFIRPNTITGLRHHWSHPSVDKRAGVYERMRFGPSMDRLRDFAKQLDSTYEELIDRTKMYVHEGYSWSEGGRFESQQVYPEFWEDFSKVTGIKVRTEQYETPFSCSC